MIILGIETSGRSGSIAITQGQTLLAEKELSATGRRHARTLVPEIGQMMQDLELQFSQLNGIAVSIGPGSFTGLRVGIVCAKTLAYALNINIVAVDTFQVIAANLPASMHTIRVIDDALRGDVYAGKYQQNAEAIQVLQEPLLISLDKLRQQMSLEEILTGPGVTKLIDEFEETNLAALDLRLPRASQVALLGEKQFLRNKSDDLWRVEPHYIRRSAAEEKADAG